MKNENQYRFNLQFTAHSDDELRVGEFLSSLGRRKSSIIIAAVIEYLDNHPDFSSESSRIRISTVSAEQLEAKIRTIIDEKLSVLPADNISKVKPVAEPEEIGCDNSDIMDMLDDLELFSGI